MGVFCSLVAVPIVSILAWVLSLAIISADFDCPYFIFEEILEDPKYRSQEVIYFTLLIRFTLCLIVCLETSRTCMFIACCLAILVDRFTEFLLILLQDIRDSYKFYICYTKFSIMFKKAENFFQLLVYLVMCICFWAQVVCCWVVVKADVLNVGFFMYTIFVIVVISLGLFHVLIIPMFCSALELTSQVVKIHTLFAEIRYSKRKSRLRKLYVKLCQSILPIRVKYGPFGTLGIDFCREYFWVIVMRVFDTILLVEY